MERITGRIEDKLILHATVGELAKTIARAVGLGIRNDEETFTGDPKKDVNKHYVYGLKGIAQLLGIHYQTAYKLKRAGMFEGAYTQINRIIVADADMILDMYNSRMKRKKRT